MPKQLNIEELIAAAQDTKDPALAKLADMLERATCQAATVLAEALAEKLEVHCGEMKNDGPGFAGFCVPFYAVKLGQPCPAPLVNYDATEWTTPDWVSLDPETGEPTGEGEGDDDEE